MTTRAKSPRVSRTPARGKMEVVLVIAQLMQSPHVDDSTLLFIPQCC